MAAVPDATGAPARAPLGTLLVERGFLSQQDLTLALAHQAEDSRPLGEILVQRGLVAAPVVAQALATQHGRLLKTEYGYATGFDAQLAEATSEQPPVSPTPVEAPKLTLRLADEAPPAPLLRVADAAAPAAEQDSSTASPAPLVFAGPGSSQVEALELELSEAVAENARLRSRLGELQLREAGLRSEHETLRSEATVVGARVAGLEAAVAALQAEKMRLASLIAQLPQPGAGPAGLSA